MGLSICSKGRERRLLVCQDCTRRSPGQRGHIPCRTQGRAGAQGRQIGSDPVSAAAAFEIECVKNSCCTPQEEAQAVAVGSHESKSRCRPLEGNFAACNALALSNGAYSY